MDFLIECLGEFAAECCGELCCGSCAEAFPSTHKKWLIVLVRILSSLLLLGAFAAVVAGIVLLCKPMRNVNVGAPLLAAGLVVLTLLAAVNKERKKRVRAMRAKPELKGNAYRACVDCKEDGNVTVNPSAPSDAESGNVETDPPQEETAQNDPNEKDA